MKFAVSDQSHYPLIVFEVQPLDPTPAQLAEHISELDEFLQRFSEHEGLFIIDITRAKFISSLSRIALGNWLKTTTPLLKKKIKGMCFVAPLIQSMLLKGVFLVSSPPIPYSIVNNREDAIQWCKTR